MRLRSLVLVASLALACPGWASAQGAQKKTAEESPKDKARKLFDQGTKALDDGDAKTALDALTEAEALYHAPSTLFHLGRAQIALDMFLEARATFQKVVDEKLGPKPPDAFKKAQTDAKTALQDLAARIPKVLLTVEPKDATNLAITMNGQALGDVRVGQASEINPGKYVFEATADGMTAAKLTVSVADRTTAEVKLVLSPIGKPPVESSVAVSGGDAWPDGRIASIPVMIAGGLIMATGGAMFGLSAARRGDADDRYAECPTCQAEVVAIDDEATLFGNLGIGFAAGGGATLLAGVLMYVLIDGAPSNEEPAVGVTIGPSEVGATWRARF